MGTVGFRRIGGLGDPGNTVGCQTVEGRQALLVRKGWTWEAWSPSLCQQEVEEGEEDPLSQLLPE